MQTGLVISGEAGDSGRNSDSSAPGVDSCSIRIGNRLRELRKAKKLSQGELERRSGLLGCYTSRVEHGHTTPSIETIKRYARALEVPLYKFFYDGDTPPKKRTLLFGTKEPEWGVHGKEATELRKFAKLLGRMSERDRTLFLLTAAWMAARKPNRRRRIRRPLAPASRALKASFAEDDANPRSRNLSRQVSRKRL
jgi:transcriptional regulator with XRE-family HTH domain